MGWIETYLQYTSAQESPEEFHLFCGLTTIAATLNRKVWLSRTSRDGVERYRLFPGQLATVLVAGSGTVRKSTAVSIAHDFMKKSGVRLFDGKISHERLLNKLGAYADGAILTVVASELETFISRSSYHDGLIGTLNKLFDCVPDTYETNKNPAGVPLKNISFTVLAATTPSSIGNALPAQAAEQGFQSRWLYVYAGKSTKIDPLTTDASTVSPQVLAESLRQRTELLDGLKRMNQLKGEFRLSSEAKKWYDDWYDQYSKGREMMKPGWPARRGDHLTRVGMLLEASATYDLTISEGSFIVADELIRRYIEANFDKTFAFIGRHASAEQQEHVLDVFRLYQNGKPVAFSEVAFRTRRFFKDSGELKAIMEFLKNANMLRQDALDARTGEEYWRMIKDN